MTVVDPARFETDVTPEIKQNLSRVQYRFDSVLGYRGGTSYVFCDYLFDSERTGLHGAVGTEMRAVPESEAKRREEKYRDPSSSPYYWEYERIDPAVGWATWIDSKLKESKDEIYDTAYAEFYGKTVRELLESRGVVDDVYVVECLWGGSLQRFNRDDFEHIIDKELWRLVQHAEQYGLDTIYE